MIVSVFNLSEGAITDLQLQAAIRAVNVQIERDFEPYWGFGATLRLEGHTRRRRGRGQRQRYEPLDMRGDGVLYVVADFDPELAGVHEKDFRGVPGGAVYLDMSRDLDEEWTVTLSHEALEMLADPQTNLVVQGPHPVDRDRQVFHWYEMCDAVQAQSYRIDGIAVSDFVLPLYFTPQPERGGRNNFLGGDFGGRTPGELRPAPLKSFGVAYGGYIGFFDPEAREDVMFEREEDAMARRRQAVKAGRSGRRMKRLQRSQFGRVPKPA
ncbi:MAG: hypothetical protein ACOY82_00415 [Pseudomonadota bacterium]